MLEHLKADDRFSVILSYVYRILGRIALVAAFLLAIAGELRGAVASLAVALWMMWSTQNLINSMMGKGLELLTESVKGVLEDIKSDLIDIQKNSDSVDGPE